MKQYINQLQYLLDDSAKKSIPFFILIFVFSSILDVVGIGLIGLFLGMLANPELLLQKLPFFSHLIAGFSQKNIVIYAGIIIAVIFMTKAFLTIAIQRRVVAFCQSYSVRLKMRLMYAYQHAPYIYHTQKNSAHLVSRLQDNVNNFINNVLLPLLLLASNLLLTSCVLGFLLIVQPLSTILLCSMFLVLGFGYDRFAKYKLQTTGKIAALSGGEIVKSINQGLRGLTEVRVIGCEDFFLRRVEQVARNYANAQSEIVAIQTAPRYLIESIMALYIVGLTLVGIATGYTLTSVVAIVGMFAAAGTRLLPTVSLTISSINQIRGSSHAMQLIYHDLKELDFNQSIHSNLEYKNRQSDKLSFETVELKRVTYHYPAANLVTIKDINLMIQKGQSIGFIGPSGSGKSTLINLILGLLQPQSGSIEVDGKVIKDQRKWLNNFAYIPQTIFLLDDTLRRNIALGVEDHLIDEKKILQAIKQAQLLEVVEQLPYGLETIIGENGVRLSGGQRQRVALARAFYHERDIIVMDEATSALDNETEREVINTIKYLKGNKTLIVIAHRLTTVEHCDVLYRLERGSITAVGTFEEVVGTAAG